MLIFKILHLLIEYQSYLFLNILLKYCILYTFILHNEI